MKTTLQSLIVAVASLFVLGSLASIEVDAQAVYNLPGDFDVSWTLDPRDDTVLFPRGPAFGGRGVRTGMDLDEDGNLEILFTTDETISRGGPDPGVIDVFLYENAGDNTYEYVWHYSNTRMTNSFPAVAYGDVDSDGLNEIYVGIPASPSAPAVPDLLFIFEQDAQRVFPSTPTITYDYGKEGSVDFRPSGMQIADVDQDGQDEIITVSRTTNAREMIVMAPDAGIDDFTTFTHELEVGETVLGGGGIYDVMVVDFDGDGNNEIWVNTWDNFSFSIFEATAADTYSQENDLNELFPNDPGSFNGHDLLFYDLDGDSALEGFFPMTDGGFYVLDNTSDVSTITGTDFQLVGYFGDLSRGGAMGDIDRDGLMDFFANTHDDETVERIEYNGSGSITDSTSYTWSTLLDSSGDALIEGYYSFAFGSDLDKDGFDELVLTNLDGGDTGQHIIVVLEYNGMPTAIDDGPAALDGFALHQNFPNPFSEVTTVRVELPRTTEITLELYDVTGRRVRVLDSGMRMAGTLETTVTAGDLPSGVYILRLDTPSGNLTRTITLMR